MADLTQPDVPPVGSGEFKPNIYPIMYWALAFGAAAGVLLFLLGLLSQFLTVAWFPVFLAGLVWGGYRNYTKQKREWMVNNGVVSTPDTPINEFKQAIRDVSVASRELMTQEETTIQPAAPTDEQIPDTPADEIEEPPSPDETSPNPPNNQIV